MSLEDTTDIESAQDASSTPNVTVASWNVSGVNNNPFEYHATRHEASARAFTRAFERVLFTTTTEDDAHALECAFPRARREALEEKLSEFGLLGTRARASYETYARERTTRDMLRDEELGAKRLCSMPDRATNTVSVDGARRVVRRPTVINCYDVSLMNEDDWWEKWLAYMFQDEVSVGGRSRKMIEMFIPIVRAKYPAVSEEEEELGVALQAFFLAAFDASLIAVATEAAGGFQEWQDIRAGLFEDLIKHKTKRTLDVVAKCLLGRARDAGATRVCFLQEVGSAFADALRAREDVGEDFDVCCPSDMDLKRDQNSIVVISKSLTNGGEAPREVTSDVLRSMGERAAALSKGDFCAFAARDAKMGINYVFASFHGDTDGLQTKHITTAMEAYCADAANAVDVCVFGMDANTHSYHKDGKKQGVVDFIDFLKSSTSFSSCWTLANVDVERAHTTFSARTFLQPQLNKAVPLDQIETHILTDRHLKDHILVRTNGARVVLRDVERVNAVDFSSFVASFDAGSMFPNASFPSDHACVLCACTFT